MLLKILLIVWLRKINAALTWWKKHFNKELVTTKKDFENSTKCWSCDNVYVDDHVKVRDNIPEKYRRSELRHYNINLKLTHKIPVKFHNIKNHDYQLIMK